MDCNIAIIGIAGKFPGADNLDQLLSNFKDGVDSVGPLSKKRIKSSTLPPDRKYMIAGYLENIDHFDHKFFNIPYSEACNMDPHQRLLLETVYHSFENAAYSADYFSGSNTGVFVADAELDYYKHADVMVPTIVTGNTKAFTATRINRQFGLKGTSIMIDTTCSSSLMALNLACNELRLGSIDMAVVCAAHIHLFPYQMSVDGIVDLNAPDGKSKAFSADANGMSVGEGAVSIILKPYEKALADNDIIHGVITGYASNSNADQAASLTAPDSIAQAEVLSKAWDMAGINPEEIGYFEAHGSGTVLGDSIEFGGIKLAFNEYTSHKQFCALSTAKSNIGHTRSVAGLSGLIRALLSLKHKVLFPTVHFRKAHPLINFEESAVYVSNELIPWPEPKENSNRRIAVVSSIGLSGTNCHVVVETPAKSLEPNEKALDEGNQTRVFPFSGHDNAALQRNLKAYVEYFDAHPELDVRDVSYTLCKGRKHFSYRVCLLADSMQSVIRQMEFLLEQGTNHIDDKDTAKVILVLDEKQLDDPNLSSWVQQIPFLNQYYQAWTDACKRKGVDAERFAYHYAFGELLKKFGIQISSVLGLGGGKVIARLINGSIDLETALEELKSHQPEVLTDISQKISKLIEQLKGDHPVIILNLSSQGAFVKTLKQQLSPDSNCIPFILGEESNSSLYRLVSLLFEKGMELNWEMIGDSLGGRRIELPSYVFEAQRCWIRDEPRVSDSKETAREKLEKSISLEGGDMVQSRVAEYWIEELNLAKISLNDNFFELGGDSLKATKVITKINQDFNIDLDFEDLFDYPQLRDFASLIDEQWDIRDKLALFWNEALQLGSIKYDDNFFELGGHSLIANQVLQSIQKNLNISLDFEDFFNNPTIQQQADFIRRLSENEEHTTLEIEELVRIPDQPYYEVSNAQKRIWLACELAGTPTIYNLFDVYTIEGAFHLSAFQQAFSSLIQRHEILRTAFVMVEGQIMQKVIPMEACVSDFIVLDLRGQENKALVLDELIESEAKHIFDFAKGSLLRMHVIRLEENQYSLLFLRHHIISDGWSLGVLLSELLAIYHAIKNNEPINLPPLRIHYRDYSHWINARIEDNSTNTHKDYWIEQFASPPPQLNFPLDFPRSQKTTSNGNSVKYLFSKETKDGLIQLAKKNEVSLYVVLLAALKTVMYHYTRKSDIVIGSILAGRIHPELENQIGFYANTVAIRSKFSAQNTFQELLQIVKRQFLDSYKHQLFPYDNLVEILDLPRNLKRNPLFDFMLILQNNEIDREDYQLGIEGAEVHMIERPIQESPFDILFNFTELTDGLELISLYSTDLFEEATIHQINNLFSQLFDTIINQNTSTIDDISFGTRDPQMEILPEVLLLDRQLRPVPTGIAGHLYLGEEIFSEDSQSIFARKVQLGRRNYIQTDVLGRWRRDESLEILSEMPGFLYFGKQIHLKSEVENKICDLLNIDLCLICVHKGDYRAYISWNRDTFNNNANREKLSAYFPESFLEKLTLIPLTGNIDKENLATAPWLLSDQFVSNRQLSNVQQSILTFEGVEEALLDVDTYYSENDHVHIRGILERSPTRQARPSSTNSSDDPQSIEAPISRPALTEGPKLEIRDDDPLTLTEALDKTRAAYPDKGIYFYNGDAESFISYSELYETALSVANGLASRGISTGQVVVLQLEQSESYFITLWACLLGGYIPVTVAVPGEFEKDHSVVQKLHSIWQLLDMPKVIVNQSNEHALAALNEELFEGNLVLIAAEELPNYPARELSFKAKPEDIAFYQLSSGSTGTPKCILETHENIVKFILGGRQAANYTPEDIDLNWVPVDHVAPLIFSHFKDVYMGITQVQLITSAFLSKPELWPEAVEKYKVTHSWGPNFFLNLISEAIEKNPDYMWDLSSVKEVMNGGEQITFNIVKEFLKLTEKMGFKSSAMAPVYGMAEVCTGVVENQKEHLDDYFFFVDKDSPKGKIIIGEKNLNESYAFANCGKVRPGVKIRIVDNQQQLLNEGEIGRIQIHSPSRTPGYLNNPKANKEAFLEDGWYNTGDLGFLWDGQLAITGREKEMLILRGNHYYYYDIEDTVNRIKGVQPTFSACTGIIDGEREGLIIFFVPEVDGIKENLEVIREIRIKITSSFGITPSYIIPLEIDKFHKTTSGKIQRNKFKTLFIEGIYDDIVKAVDLAEKNRFTIENYFFKKKWVEKKLRRNTRPDKVERTILLFSEDAGLIKILGEAMPLSRIITVARKDDFSVLDTFQLGLNPDNSQDYALMFDYLDAQNLRIDTIIHAWQYETDPMSVLDFAPLQKANRDGVYSLVSLLQALPLSYEHKIQLIFTSSNGRMVKEEDIIQAEKTTAYGLLMSITQEYPNINAMSLDVPLMDKTRLGEIIRNELGNTHDEEKIAYRNGRRYILGLEKLNFDQLEKENISFKPEGFYLISGGLGEIGFHVAEMLSEKYQAKLVLIGRTSLQPENESNAPEKKSVKEKQQRLNALRLKNDYIRYLAIDVCDEEQLKDQLAILEEEWGQRLDGIIHAAGTGSINEHWSEVGQHLIQQEKQSYFELMFGPKVYGTVTLAKIASNYEDFLFLSFSSVNSFFGGNTFSAYSAANSFLDYFTRYLGQNHNIQAKVINWSMWDGVGMSRDNALAHLTAEKGFSLIQLEKGIAALQLAMSMQEAEILIGLDSSNAFIRKHLIDYSQPQQQLVLFYSPNAPVKESELLVSVRNHFEGKADLRVMEVVNWPTEGNGQLDYEALLKTKNVHKDSQTSEKPSTEEEIGLANIWKDLLGKSEIQIYDNFFELGGNSIKATQLISMVHKRMNVKLNLSQLFAKPTIYELAAEISVAEEMIFEEIVEVKEKDWYDVSHSQKQLWILDQLEEGQVAYNIPGAYWLHGKLNIDCFRQTITEIVKRHEILRTSFHNIEGEPRQVIHPFEELDFDIEVVDLSRMSSPASQVQQMANDIKSLSFDLEKAPLLIVKLIKLEEEKYAFIFNMHHIIADGWSFEVLTHEISALYNAFSKNQDSPLKPLRIQYNDYTVWLNKQLSGKNLERLRKYWLNQMSGELSYLNLRTDYPRPQEMTFSGDIVRFEIGEELTHQLKSFCQQNDITLFMALLSVLKILMYKYTGNQQIIIGSPVLGRSHEDLNDLVGLFLNAIALRTFLSGEDTGLELVKKVTDTTLGAFDHDLYPIDMLVDDLAIERESNKSPLYNVIIIVQNIGEAGVDEFSMEGIRVEEIETEYQISKSDLVFQFGEDQNKISAHIEFNNQLFESSSVQELKDNYLFVLSQLLADTSNSISNFQIIRQAKEQSELDEITQSMMDM